ncbi:MAG: hypothetical protein JXB47_03165 [Anaerolineae bacterium]|nr:hypothetical protein [Anaerolineae bacterium]
MSHKFWIYILLACLLMALPAAAQEDGAAGTPQEVSVAVYILRVGKLDFSSGTYTLDFYLDLWCTECDERFPGAFTLMNGAINSKQLLIDDPNWKSYRIQATLAENFDLSGFPFDSHNLSVVIGDDLYTSDDLVYAVDAEGSAIDDYVYITGWDLDPTWRADVEDRYYSVWDSDWSVYTFRMTIRKPFLASLLKGIMPAVLIVIGSFSSLFISPDKAASRFPINTATLIGSVVFHLNLTSSLPPVGYLTFADIFMFINYFVVIITMLVSIAVLRLTDQGKRDLAGKVNVITAVCLPIAWGVMQLAAAQGKL